MFLFMGLTQQRFDNLMVNTDYIMDTNYTIHQDSVSEVSEVLSR